ncbi:MAG: tetratricopeptide repeat protein [Rhodomicrobium sp.]
MAAQSAMVPVILQCEPGGPKARRQRYVWHSAFAAAALTFFLAGCGGSLDSPVASAGLAVPSDSPNRLGAENFNRGEYGLAESNFREAVEKSPHDASSWIGLAASYDRLRRFDLADRAYQQAIKLSGETAQILNNQGYSYLLRGNLAKAKAKLSKARALEPDNPTTLNNLKLLEAGAKYAKPGAL